MYYFLYVCIVSMAMLPDKWIGLGLIGVFLMRSEQT